MFLPAGCGTSTSNAPPSPTPVQGTVQIGFTDSPSSGFQSILLNVISVRLNPSTNGSVSESDPNWVEITAPPGIGAVGELQIDLNQLQNTAKLFNSAVVPAQPYYQVEVTLDTLIPGSIVPTCSSPGVVLLNEGCIAYGMTFSAGSTLKLNLAATNSPIEVTDNGLTPVVIDFNAGVPLAPSTTNGNYTVSPQISVQPYTNFLGLVNGTVNGTINTGLIVNAELSGTNTVIANATVLSGTACPTPTPAASSTSSGGCFTMSLPAAQQGGTAYDFFLSLPTTTVKTEFFPAGSPVSGQVVTRNSSMPLTLTATSESTSGNITGKVVSEQSGDPIEAATVELLAPSTNDPSTNVVVASTATGPSGNYTLSSIPTGSYGLNVLESGFDPLTSTVTVASSGAACSNGTSANSCDFALTSTAISGSIELGVVASSDLDVMVIAEDTGTVNIENFTTVKIPAGQMTEPFTITVPTSVQAFDLVASVQDSFEGGTPSSLTGHSIAVLSNVSGASSGTSLDVESCLGHGSISGIAANPDSGTAVRLFKDDAGGVPVAIAETQVAPVPAAVPSGSPTVTAGAFSLCVPPDTYQIQRFENGSPVASSTGVPTMATPAPGGVPVPITTPSATPTPICPICGTLKTCPGLCSNTPLGFTLPSE